MTTNSAANLLEAAAADYFELNTSQRQRLLSNPFSESFSIDLDQRPARGRKMSSKSPVQSRQQPVKRGAQHQTPVASRSGNNKQTKSIECRCKQSGDGTRTRTSPARVGANQSTVADDNTRQSALSPTGSSRSTSMSTTNSLPSISSSPSISPSLVCPHMSLDDILATSPTAAALSQASQLSPHTIGLCASCRLDPPANIHSPLSPLFKPYNNLALSRRSKSDQQSILSAGERKRRQQLDDQAKKKKQQPGSPGTTKSNSMLRNDSLDYYLEPSDLRRLQMSPTLRNSVEFIRNNSIESGRVVRIYKNGQPFDKPLRVCILRNEFASINHLLDHIGSRQLIPSGARYLFHLDGQLIYSVHELKHGSIYIVSGTRSFDYRANKLLKEQFLKEQLSKANSRPQEEPLGRAQPEPSGEPVSKKQPKSAKQTNPTASKPPTSQQRQQKTADNKTELKQQKAPKLLSESTDNLHVNPSTPGTTSDQPEEVKMSKLSRAKSEMSQENLRVKRKKNVTFVDDLVGAHEKGLLTRRSVGALNGAANTNQEQPPLESKQQQQQPRKSSENLKSARKQNTGESTDLQALATNDIGIQVSDSIEGFLIDLPIPMPAKGDDSNLPKRRPTVSKTTTRTRQVLVNKRAVRTNKSNNEAATSENNKSPMGQKARRRQIVTITERQLSSDELDTFKDLDHGDHHHQEDRKNSTDRSRQAVGADGQPAIPELQIDLDHSKRAREVEDEEEAALRMSTSTSDENAVGQPARPDEVGGNDDKWQYVSKASDGDQPQTPSKDLSRETPVLERAIKQNEPNQLICARVTTPTTLTFPEEGAEQRQSLAKEGREPSKQSIDVTGNLFSGCDEPKRNFRLVWVNGIAINDQYPENCLIGGQLNSNASDRGGQSQQVPQIVFKPNERFHNWLCYSARFNELIYPAGTLVVVWCKWTNGQRYYARHSTNVSAVTMSALDADLMASAQVSSSARDSAQVHLWSLATLDTLRVIKDEQLFLGKRVFSLKLKGTKRGGCELAAGARDEQRQQLSTILVKCTRLDAEPADKTSETKTTKASQVVSAAMGQKSIQLNQIPLLVLPITTGGDATVAPDESKSPKKSKWSGKQRLEMVLTFGRRQFNLWSQDSSRLSKSASRLSSMQMEKSGSTKQDFIELISRANCLIRLAPSELIVGDSAGCIALLLLDFSGATGSNQPTPTKPGKSANENAAKYNVETVYLHRPSADQSGASPSSVTSLTRITGNLFISSDSAGSIRFWRLKRNKRRAADGHSTGVGGDEQFECQQVNCIALPADLGLICSIVLANYDRKRSLVEFYVCSASNTVLFNSIRLDLDAAAAATTTTSKLAEQPQMSCSVVFEGHETAATSLVADVVRDGPARLALGSFYFTCSLDCRVCKWQGKQLMWKSLLPSACVSLAVHPAGCVLAIGSIDGTVYILDKSTGLLISYFPLTPVLINCLAYSRDGALLAAGCSNGSIFILPVYERGLKYKKVSIFQSPNSVVSLQFSTNNRFILTSVTHGSYQELVLWDLPNFRYMRANVKLIADKIQWFDSICSGSEDVRAIWENSNYFGDQLRPAAEPRRRPAAAAAAQSRGPPANQQIVNLSCHRLIRRPSKGAEQEQQEQHEEERESFVIASDANGYVRLFQYPSYDIEQAFYARRISSMAVNCCRFIDEQRRASFVTSSIDGSICMWRLTGAE